jgi:hypothetical protein
MQFGADVVRDQLWFSHSGNDLVASISGTGDSVAVKDWYTSGANQLGQFTTADGAILADAQVENLVAAMAPPPAGQTMLTTQEHQQLDGVIAANWR